MPKQERVMVFIDGANVYNKLRDDIGGGHFRPIDFGLFGKLVAGADRRLVKVYYYVSPVDQYTHPSEYSSQQQFFAELRKITYLEVRLGSLRPRTRSNTCPNCKHRTVTNFRVEKGVDVHLAVDMLSCAFDDQYDCAVVVSEDADFAPAADEVRRYNKKVQCASFTRKPPYLAKHCDSYIELTKSFLSPCFLPSKHDFQTWMEGKGYSLNILTKQWTKADRSIIPTASFQTERETFRKDFFQKRTPMSF